MILYSLEVHVVTLFHVQGFWYEVILHSRVHLDDVASLTTNVYIVDHSIAKISGAWLDFKHVTPENKKHFHII